MDKNIIFSILKIEPTKEEEKIKQAYHNLLIQTNPEDDPEGFKRLRQAYEEALSYARQKDEVSEEKEETPISIWLDKVIANYSFLSERLKIGNWKRLLEEEVCLDLDTSIEARDALLSYLMDHYRLTPDIWRLVDKTFLISEEYKELYEKFPTDFIDFILSQCEREESFPYELFEGDDEADYDTYLYHYYDLTRKADEGDYKTAAKILSDMDDLFIEHPVVELERARIAQGMGNSEEALSIIEPLLEKYPKEMRIQILGAEILWKNEKKEAAFAIFEIVAEQNPTNYLVNKRLSQYYLDQGDYEKAKTHCVEALRVSSNEEELLNELTTINKILIDIYEKELDEQKELLFKRHLEMAWCYLQNHLAEEGISHLSDRQPDIENAAEFHSVLGRLYYMKKDYYETVEQAKQWIEAIEEEEKKEEEEEQKKPARMAAAYEMMAQSYRQLGEQEALFYESALNCIDQAIQLGEEDKITYLTEKANIFMSTKQYEKVVDICDELLKLDNKYFWGYVIRQEAYFELHDGQNVIDDFYNAKEIFSYYPKIYELAASVFMHCNQLEDAKNILQQAKEMEVTSHRLMVMNISVGRQLAEDKKDLEQVLEEGIKVKESLEEEKAQPKDEAELYYELARCCRNLDRQKKALEYIEKAIQLQPDSLYLWIKGNIFLDERKYYDALKLYLLCKKDYANSDIVMGNIGYCYKRLDKIEKAISYFQEALNINPENTRCNSELVDIYTDLLRDNGDITYYDKGILFADRQIELTPDSYSYIDRGLLHMEAGQFDLALEDFKKVIELDPDNPHAWNNIGCIYKYTRQYKKAIESFRKAAELMKDEPTAYPYGNLGDCYERMGKNKEALAAYTENKKLFPNSRFSYNDLSDVYRKMKQYEKAIKVLAEYYEQNSVELLEKEAVIYLEMGKFSKGISCYKKIIAKDKERADIYILMGDAYLYLKEKIKTALKLYETARSIAETGTKEYRDSLFSLLETYYFSGQQKKGKKYFEALIKDYVEVFGSVEGYINTVYSKKIRLRTITLIYFYAGEVEKAKEYFKRLEEEKECRRCSYTECFEQLLLKALLCEGEGKQKEAKQLYTKVLQIDPNNFYAKMRLD